MMSLLGTKGFLVRGANLPGGEPLAEIAVAHPDLEVQVHLRVRVDEGLRRTGVPHVSYHLSALDRHPDAEAVGDAAQVGVAGDHAGAVGDPDPTAATRARA